MISIYSESFKSNQTTIEKIMKIILIHSDIALQMSMSSLINDKGKGFLWSNSVDCDILIELTKTKKALVIVQWGLLREGTGNFVASLRRNEEFQIWVISGGFTDDDDPIAQEMLRAGADKAFCTTEIWEHLLEAGLTKS